MTAPSSSLPTLRVRLLWLPEAMPGTLFAALDVLRTAARIAQLQQPGSAVPIRWQLIGANGRKLPTPFVPAPKVRAGRPGAARELLLIPGLAAENAPQLGEILARSSAALRLVERHVAEGGWVAACTTGLVFPAELGLLAGQRVAAPWAFQSWLARRYPGCDFAGDEPFALAGRVFTCVAPALVSEFMLRVLGHLCDVQLAQTCAQIVLHQPQRQQLTPALVAQRWLARTSDSPVYRAMQWLKANLEHPYRLAAVAEAAAVSERTLLRHFRQVTGETPLDYLHGLRIERAKLLLEVTLHGIPAIAEACGYADAAAFRRLFQRETGMTMSAYRARHALRARRSFWRVERSG